jgi:hypothetical protein
MQVLSLPSTKPRFLGHPACRNKYRATEIAYEKSKITNRKGNLALRRVDGTAVTIGTVKSAVAVAAAGAAAVAVAAAAAGAVVAAAAVAAK